MKSGEGPMSGIPNRNESTRQRLIIDRTKAFVPRQGSSVKVLEEFPGDQVTELYFSKVQLHDTGPVLIMCDENGKEIHADAQLAHVMYRDQIYIPASWRQIAEGKEILFPATRIEYDGDTDCHYTLAPSGPRGAWQLDVRSRKDI